jgi:GNAT superfamily N-acetyltransferase
MPFVDRSFARRLEMAHARRSAAYTEAQGKLHADGRIAVEPVAGGHVCYAGAGSPLNRAVGVGLRCPVREADLSRIEQFYHSRHAPSRIDVCPLADPSLLGLPGLRRYGLEGFYSVLFCSLPQDVVSIPLSPGIRISQAEPAQAELWIRTVAQGFGEQDVPGQETLDLLAPNFYSRGAICFFAWVDGQPAGGGAIYTYDGVAEFGSASTRPQYRRRGVQTALLQAGLRSACAQGCDVAMVLTSPGSDSQRNVERAGLRLAYTKAVLVEGDPHTHVSW